MDKEFNEQHLTDAQLKDILDYIKQKTEKKAIKINLDYNKKPGLFNSKVGGTPYWDTNMKYPENDNGEKLILLAQFNMSELPENNIFPKEGMLQFFAFCDDLYGASFDEPSNGGYKVVFHKQINADISEKDIDLLDIPTTLNLQEDDDVYFPVVGEFALSFENRDVFMNDCDSRFMSLLYEAAKELNIDIRERMCFFELCDKEQFLKAHRKTEGHWLLGYPFFTQGDPRNGKTRDIYDTLLFQLDSETRKNKNEIMWGDFGVGAFFINSRNLAELNFDDVLYVWDCE